ncbi:MAG TPA: hypothetical protein DEA50_03775 [Parvularcula sp.]|nr:hypothetical protein [Parvularcula sp.]
MRQSAGGAEIRLYPAGRRPLRRLQRRTLARGNPASRREIHPRAWRRRAPRHARRGGIGGQGFPIPASVGRFGSLRIEGAAPRRARTSRCSVQRLILPVSLALCALAAPALAQEDAAPGEAGRKTGLYVRGAAGFSFPESLDQDFSYSPSFIPIVAPPTAKSTDLGGGGAWSAAIGFQYARTRTELEYRRFDLDADEIALTGGAAPSTVTGAGDVTAQAIMTNVYFDLVNSSRLTPYIGAGVGGARVENELGQRDAAFAYQGRVGVELALSPALSLGVEYSYFRTAEIVYGPKDFDTSLPPTSTFSDNFQRLDGDHFAASSVMGSLRLVF